MTYLDAPAKLLDVAHTVLRDRVLARLDGEARYEAAMIANALAIAARELELGPDARAQEHELLADYYDTPSLSLGELRRRLCRDLRAGGVEHERELRSLLQIIVEARLRISNPAYLTPSRP